MFPADVPVHRESVGAMALSAPPVLARRPYVYGTSPRRLRPEQWRHSPQAEVEADWDKPKPKPKFRPKATPEERKAMRKRRSDRLKQERERERQRYEERYRAWQQRLAEEKAMHEAARVRDLEREQVFREAAIARRKANPPRPAPGWKPMRGGDIDDLLAELEQA